MLFLFSQPYLRSVPGLKKNLCCGDMTLIFLHTPSLQDCDETVLDKLDSLNDSEPKVRRFRAKPCCSLSSCEDYPLDERFWSPFLLVIIELKQQRRRRVRKRHLKSEFALPQTLSLLFLELNSKGLHQSSGKENCCLVFPSSTKRKIRKFHVVVVQPRLRKMYKKAWWTCKVVFLGGNLSLMLLCRSRWRRRRRCLSSLLTVPNPRGPEQEFEVDIRFGLRKQPRFRDATLVYPRNDVWETSADIPYWWRVTTQIWIVSRRQYGISALVSQTSFRGEISGDVAKCQLFSQATSGFNLYSTRIQVWLCAGVKIWAQLKFEMLCPCASVAVLCYKFFLWLLNQILWDTITLACFNTSVEEMCTSIISFPM